MKKILLLSALCATIVFGGADVLPVEKRTFEQSKFIPDVSLIMDTSLVSRNIDNDEAVHLEIPDVVHGLLGSHSHEGESHSPYNANNGFNLNYAELVLSSSVDPFFTMDGIFHYSEGGVEIEELYFTSSALSNGLRLKGGKFSSNFGYLNETHHHAWSFADMPLVYESFLGMHGINEKGLQVQWVAPTSTYLMIGAEILQGENEQMFGNQSIHLDDLNSTNPHIESARGPSLYIGYIKTSFDVGDATVLGGVSYAKGSSIIDHSDDEEEPHAFSGDSTLYGIDLTIKHYFDSYSFLTFQSEFLSRKMEGIQYTVNTDTMYATAENLTKEQSGLYSQLVYAHDKSWQMGLRYESIYQNDGLNKYSAMIEYHTSEFARFRLQYNRNEAMFDELGSQMSIDTIILQANISIGAHGAHSF